MLPLCPFSTCVTPGMGFHVIQIREENIVVLCVNVFFLHTGVRRGPARTTGANLGPGRAPLLVFCVFKVANMASNRGVGFRGDRAEQDNGKPTCSLLAPLL